ncbi:uncharacterized protein LOC106879054 [Octopus bimaculoides]|uniref:uncharacterized protein LOC106879054 n=1 Tax=Octopus bimaculoides TaxID=37653 RepID=UPI00071D616C|nr:uncharacterized protein LOC106879054 [Octopus bimaculoides]|eukprot:XP_014783964.1 PREDICTED: uncharacterized protein LOC106879054 isoform X1 [Octopus bimaculoides]
MNVERDQVRTNIHPMYTTENISFRIPNSSWKLHRSLHNGYLYKEKNRPRPICLPIHRHEHPVRIQQVEFAEDYDISDIERLDDSSPMLIIQKYNGFRQGTRDRQINRCSRSDERNSSKATETTYRYSSTGTSTGYASDVEDEIKEPSNTLKICTEKNHVNSAWFWSEMPHTCQCQRLTGRVSLNWKCRREKKKRKKQSCILSIDSGDRTRYPKINIESEICSQRELQTSEHSDKSEFALLQNGNVDLSTECKANNIKSFFNCPSNNGNVGRLPCNHCDSENVNPIGLAAAYGNRNDKKVNPFKSTENKCGKSFRNVRDADSAKTVGNFYMTILPSELDNNQMITKVNPLIFYEDSGNEDDDSLSSSSDEQRNSGEENDDEFIYSIEEFPHPPDHFFASDTASLTSLTIMPHINSEANSENLQLNDFDNAAEKFSPFFIHNKHFTFQVDQTIMRKQESTSSSNDGFSDFLCPCTREGELVSTSASGDSLFNPSGFVTASESLFDFQSEESISAKAANTQQWIMKSFNSVDRSDSRIEESNLYGDDVNSCICSIRNKLISNPVPLQNKSNDVQTENHSREISQKSTNLEEISKQNAHNETVGPCQFKNQNTRTQFRNKFQETSSRCSESLHITVSKRNQSVQSEKTDIDDSASHIDHSDSGSIQSECIEECMSELLNTRLAAVKDMLQRASTLSSNKEGGCKCPRN